YPYLNIVQTLLLRMVTKPGPNDKNFFVAFADRSLHRSCKPVQHPSCRVVIENPDPFWITAELCFFFLCFAFYSVAKKNAITYIPARKDQLSFNFTCTSRAGTVL